MASIDKPIEIEIDQRLGQLLKVLSAMRAEITLKITIIVCPVEEFV